MLLGILDESVTLIDKHLDTGTIISMTGNNLWYLKKDQWVILNEKPVFMWDLIQEGKIRVLLDI